MQKEYEGLKVINWIECKEVIENLKEEARLVLQGRVIERIDGSNRVLKEDLEKGIGGNKTVEEANG